MIIHNKMVSGSTQGSNRAEGVEVRPLFVVWCVRSGFCDELIIRSEESYWVCLYNFVSSSNLKEAA
jgi:hypothetical protein